MFWKKGSLLLLAAMLLLAGCAGEASLVRDAMVASLENPNYDYQGTIKVTGNFDQLLELSGEAVDDEIAALLDALQAGLTFTGSQLDLNRAKVVLELNDDNLLREHGLWSGDDKAALELLLDTNTTYLKTPLDEKYVAIDTVELDQSGVDPKALQDFQEKLNKLTFDFMKDYFADYGFKLSQVENHGSKTVTLPNNEKVETTHLTITLDTKELINLFLYTAKDAVTNENVRSYAIDLLTAIRDFAEATGEEFPESDIDIEELVDTGLSSLKEAVDTLEKNYTVEQIAEMVKEWGLASLELKMDYYINKDKLPVRSISAFHLTLEDPSGELAKPLTVGVEADTYAWNFGKASHFSFPQAEQTITLEQVAEGDVDGLNENGFLYAIVTNMSTELSTEIGVIVFDLNDKTTTLDGELQADVKPYQDPQSGTTMVPFRFIGEAMGAEISYDDASKTATFVKDDIRIALTNGSKTAQVNGEAVELPQPAVIKDGSFYVPLRFVSEQLGAEVIWIDELKQALITYEK